MTDVQPQTAAAPQNADVRHVLRLDYALAGDLRFLSHHEQIGFLTRAMIRADWPLAYSRGFNPQPRLTLPLPRSVGTASDCECATVVLNTAPPLRTLFETLDACLPADCALRYIAWHGRRTPPHPVRTVYAVPLRSEDARGAEAEITDLMTRQRIPVQREYGPDKPARTVDIRPYIETITLAADVLVMRLVFQEQRTARPGEILQALKLLDADYEYRVRRTAVEWDLAPDGSPCWPPVPERIKVDQEESCCT